MKRLSLALLIALGLGTAPAIAADTGFYAGAGIGIFSTDISESDIGLNFDEDDTGFKVFGGYQFLPWLGGELAYIDGGESSVSESDPVLGSAKLEVDVSAITAAAVGTLPIGEMFELYGKLGIAMWDGKLTASASGLICEELELGATCAESVSDDGTDFFWGIGAGVNIGEQFNVRIEYEVLEIDPEGVNADTDFLSLSGVYRF